MHSNKLQVNSACSSGDNISQYCSSLTDPSKHFQPSLHLSRQKMVSLLPLRPNYDEGPLLPLVSAPLFKGKGQGVMTPSCLPLMDSLTAALGETLLKKNGLLFHRGTIITWRSSLDSQKNLHVSF